MTAFYHTPVLRTEVLSFLSITPNHWYIDGTLGGGGYSLAILQAGGKVIGIDRDPDAIRYVKERFKTEVPEKEEEKDWILIQNNFRNIIKISAELKDKKIAGVVLDLGISSYQLDTKERGFSYRFEDAPLDMRMNKTEGISASSVLNTYSKEELYDIFTRFGEEERAWSVVDALTVARRVKPLETVQDVKQALKAVKGEKDRILARIFQAVRIEVNDELGSLQEGLEGAEEVLPVHGKLVVVSFHSLEDRYVKRFLQRPKWKRISDVVVASEEEQEKNSRSRSAKLRAGEKIYS